MIVVKAMKYTPITEPNPLQMATYAEIHVWDALTNSGVPTAIVIQRRADDGKIVDSGTTDANGYLRLTAIRNTAFVYAASKAGYFDNEVTVMTPSVGYAEVNILLTPNPNPPPEHILSVYCVANDAYRVRQVLVSAGGKYTVTDAVGLAKLILPEGSVLVATGGKGYVTRPPLNIPTEIIFTPASFSANMSMDRTYTFWVEQEKVVEGNPPANPEEDPWLWLKQNWQWVALGIGLFSGALAVIYVLKPATMIVIEREH
jgi:hypothetical protein